MKHTHFFALWYTNGCPPCKVRQILYGFRLDPVGMEQVISEVIRSWKNPVERQWILNQVKGML